MIHFQDLRTANLTRFQDFGDKYPYNPNDWGLTEWAVAIAGEAGELCNLKFTHITPQTPSPPPSIENTSPD